MTRTACSTPPTTSPPSTEIVNAYKSLKDPSNGNPLLEKVLTKAQLGDVDGSDSLNPTRSGDVVVVTKVPYEFDANTVGTLVAPSQFFGQHGYLPEDVDLKHNINMHATFVAGGPDILHVPSVRGVHATDLAPTLAILGGFNPPLQAQGKVSSRRSSGAATATRPVRSSASTTSTAT